MARLFLLLLATVPAAAAAQFDAGRDPARFADEIFRLTNAHRTANRLPAFRRDARLDRAAVLFSQYMAREKFMSHTGPDGVTMAQRITAQRYAWVAIGENVAWNQRSPQEVVDG